MPAHEKLGTQFTTVFHPANPKSMGGVSHHTMEAWAPEHVNTEWAKAHPSDRMTFEGSDIDPGFRPVGSMSWHHKTGEIRGVYTQKEHQRQGIASSLYRQSSQLATEKRGVPQPRHSEDRTDAGDAWAKSVGGRLPRRGR